MKVTSHGKTMVLRPAIRGAFDEEYANGKLSSLHGMQIEYMSLDTESDSDSDIVITDMTFEDEGEQYTPEHLLPYVISMEG